MSNASQPSSQSNIPPSRSSFNSVRSRFHKISQKSKSDLTDDAESAAGNPKMRTTEPQIPPPPLPSLPNRIEPPRQDAASASQTPNELDHVSLRPLVGQTLQPDAESSQHRTSLSERFKHKPIPPLPPKANEQPGIKPSEPKQSAPIVDRPVVDRPVDERPPGPNPFEQQDSLILQFFIGTLVAVILLCQFSVLLAAAAAVTGIHVLRKKLQATSKDAEWLVEMAEAAKKAADPTQNTESAEWINQSLAVVWPLINSEYFAPFIDLLEDSLMAQVPGIVHSVRVEDVDQGTIPLRIRSFKVLPPDEWSFLESPSCEPKPTNLHDLSASESDGQPNDDSNIEGTGIDIGDFVNLEITFAYRGVSSKKDKGVAKNATNLQNGSDEPVGASALEGGEETLLDMPTERIHLLIYMSIGLQKIAAVEVPVWVEMVGIEGKMRLRLQMTPVAPFVKHAAFTFVGLPKLEMSAKPLGKKMVIDAMNLPLISSFVLRSVEKVIRGFIAPKSYTVDVARLLGTGDGPQEVYAIGVIGLIIHQATNLAAADANGQSDPFVQAAFSRSKRSLFTTRVLVKTKQPVWQEVAFLLVSPDEIRDHERLRLTVFDADRFSADDPLGKIEISLDRLAHRFHVDGESHSTTLFETRTKDLRPMRRGAPVQGKLKFSIGFFCLTNTSSRSTAVTADSKRPGELQSINKALSTPERPPPPLPPKPHTEAHQADNSPPPTRPQTAMDPSEPYLTAFDRFIHGLGLPVDEEVIQRRRERKARVNKLVNLLEGVQTAATEPPNPEFPSGILAFHIHSIDNLEIQTTKRSYSNSKRLSHKQQYTQTTEETLTEGTGQGKLPSSYVQVFLNDEAIFRTRTKPLNPRPYINSGSERFLADWTTARIDFAVRDARMREGDPVLGCVGLKVAEVLKQSSKSTEWYTLTGGLGNGKIRISLLFHSVGILIPKPLRGWNVGVIEIGSCKVTGLAPYAVDKKECHIQFETVGGKAETGNVDRVEEHESGQATSTTISYEWPLKDAVRLPVRQRYPNNLYIQLRSESRMPGRKNTHALAYVSLKRLADDSKASIRVPLFAPEDWQKIEQEMLYRETLSDELPVPASERSEGEGSCQLLPALEDLHQKLNQTYQDLSKSNPLNNSSGGHHIGQIGWLELNLIFHRGIAPEHRSCVAGDHEMRFAFESYMALIDAGERSRPKSFSAERWRQLCADPDATSTDTMMLAASDTDNMTTRSITIDSFVLPQRHQPSMKEEHEEYEEHEEHEEQTGLPCPNTSGSTALFQTEAMDHDGSLTADPEAIHHACTTSIEPNMAAFDTPSGTESETEAATPEGRRTRRRALHRQQMGAAQIKGFRTLSWIKTNAEDGMSKVKRQFDKQNKKIGKMESEGVSYF